MSDPKYPGHELKAGEPNVPLVRAIQKRLNALGCRPLVVDGDWGPATTAAVRLFQGRFTALNGTPLKVDGVVGPITWGALFPEAPAAPQKPVKGLAAKALVVAGGEIGVMEEPPGSNRGPRVAEYLAAVDLDASKGHYAWCAAFVCWVFREAARALGVENPLPMTAGALALWNRSAGRPELVRVTAAEARAEVSLVKPGQVFVLSTGGGLGHVGIVESVSAGVLATIEGNTNDGGSREGIGVFRRAGANGRKVVSINKGFVGLA